MARWIAAAWLGMGLITACGPSGRQVAARPVLVTPAPPPPSPAATAPSPRAAPAPRPLALGTASYDLSHGGLDRSFVVQTPPELVAGRAYPVVFVLHGAGVTNVGIAERLQALVTRYEWIGVYPQGYNYYWNAGLGEPTRADDVAFTGALLEWLAARVTIDRRRVYAAGYSDGGGLCQKIARERSWLAAIATIAGSLPVGTRIPATAPPVAVMHVHGDRDAAVPFLGGIGAFGADYLGARASAALWAEHNGCASAPVSRAGPFDSTEVRFGDCDSGREVRFYHMPGIGHEIPPHRLEAIDQAIWAFFAEQVMPMP